MKKKLVLKPFVVPTLYTIFSLVVIISLFLSIEVVEEKEKTTYVNSSILDQYIPVVGMEETVQKPFTDENITVANSYYNYNSSDEQQLSSIIYHENTYIQNTGINYKLDKEFDVVSILSGEVIEVENKELLGKSVTIRHDNNIISVYQSLGNVNVKKGELVSTGQIIGTSGSCDLIKESEHNLHFELYANGVTANPEDYYDKKVSDL